MRKLYIICLTFALLCTVAYAAKKYPMTAASIVPGARAEVAIGKDKNGNTRLKMTVQHLANLGQLKVNKNLKAIFVTVTPLKSFDVFVTAEQDPRTDGPSGQEVLRATIQP